MYSDKKNILQLTALLKAYKIEHVVICPGSRNAAITHSLTNDPEFICHTVVDERSAGFYALGISLHGKKTAVCCTSGTAVLNLGPAVAEAYYQHLPLVIITADRPQAWIGQMDGQTIPQPGVFNTLVKKSVQLPEIHTEEEEWYCNRLINEALLELDYRRRGPVHINIPVSEPLLEFTTQQLPEVRKIRRHYNKALKQDELVPFGNRFTGFKKRMIFIGQDSPPGITTGCLEAVMRGPDCVILAELHSNIHPTDCISNFDAMLYALPKDKWSLYAPDLLITMGGNIVSKRFKEFIRKYPPKEHWVISLSDEISDLFQCVTDVIETTPLCFMRHLATLDNEHTEKKNAYQTLWNNLRMTHKRPRVTVYSDMFAIQTLLHLVPENSALHFANSSAIRLAHLFPLTNKNVEIFANRGTNGIDGSVSTAVGYATTNHELTFLLIGDLAFFYDMNGLWNKQLSHKLRILINNNEGGEIFHTIPGLKESKAIDYITAPHKTNAKGWAETMGFRYIPVSNSEDLLTYMENSFVKKSNKPIIMEVFTSMKSNLNILRDYYYALKNN